MSGPGLLEIRRRLPAPIAEVFSWWTDAERLRQWMSPQGVVEAEVDFRVGGAFRIVMKGEGVTIGHTGEYLEIDRPRRIVFTWNSDYTGPGVSIVSVDFEADGSEATLLHLVHSELPEAAALSHRDGWGAMLDRLAGGLSER